MNEGRRRREEMCNREEGKGGKGRVLLRERGGDGEFDERGKRKREEEMCNW